MRLGFGVVGLGAISKTHLDAISTLPEARLVAVASRQKEKAFEVGRTYGCEAYTDWRQILERKDIDVVTVVTASGARRDIVLAAAVAGKHVIVEKPIEVTTARADEMIEACERAGVVLAGIFQFRFKPAWQLLKKAVEDGRLGKLYLGDAYNKWYRTREYYASSSWRGTWALDGGGALMNQGIHVIDLLQWIMGDVREVSAYARTLRHSIEVEDTAVAIVSYASGAVGVIEGTTSVYPGYPTTMEIHGEQGSVRMAGDFIVDWSVQGMTEAERAQVESLLVKNASQSTASDPRLSDCTYHRLNIADVINAIMCGREPLVSGREARKSVALIEAIYTSSREGRPVKLS